ncbi:inositol monophosphatase family protein [Roseospira goensis]|uniref:Fructose-1,6-bisphosphatase/inositol monophosphatase family enzyme n=1 Tax=Roseospira goensis TaxID=391922 RepID=A0A7W6RWW9_9PROT|nr:inositol monophosphatase family protein [Roseospira goensis]MBB4284720.1 fructose-1,6-bisphosphatase/inositol monophosphatase family enzyme [Roseospira goensis]
MALSIPITAVTEVLHEVAEAEVLSRFRNLSRADIRSKSSSQDLVTLADIEAERVLTRRLPDLLPGSSVVGEEAAYADPGVLDRLTAPGPVWIVDPVDGTGNFSKGIARFGMIVALAYRGETVAGWILDPIDGRIAVAERGAGATLDGRRVAIKTDVGRLGTLEGCAFGPRSKVLKGRVRRFHHLGSAAQVYLGLLQNRLQFGVFSRLMPWDHAAGILLHAEAGGQVGLLDGTPYRPALRRGDLLLAPNAALWDEMRSLLRAVTVSG